MHILIAATRALLVGAVLATSVVAHAHEPAAKPAPIAPLSGEAAAAASVVDAFHAALGRGDTAAALRLLTDGAVIFEAGGAERSKAEYAAHHLGADAAFAQAVPDTTTRRTGEASGTVAWIATEGRTTGRYKDRPLDRVTTETMVLVRAGDGWRIAHIHWSSRAP